MLDDEAMEVARAAVRLEALAVANVENQLDQTLLDAVKIIERSQGKVLTTGSGTSSQIARRLAHLLSVSGTPAMFIHSMDALHGTVGAVQQGDILIAFSKTGESDEVIDLGRMVQDRGVRVIGIGEYRDSSLGRLSDVFVELHTPVGADPGETLAMGSTLVHAVWGDALARVLMARRGWETNDSLRIHPAGGVGKLARESLSTRSEENDG